MREDKMGVAKTTTFNTPEICCVTCGKNIDVCYTDNSVLGLFHGMCQCRKCYIKDEHPECESCKELLSPQWKYCPHCGVRKDSTIKELSYQTMINAGLFGWDGG